MGLDIYLYSAADGAANKLYDEACDAFYGRDDFDQLSEADREAIRKELPEYVPHADVPSERYPDHLFNRRYLRSSYNGGGFNRAVPDFVGEDHGLYWIFEPMGREWDGDEGQLTEVDVPKLSDCRKRAEQVAEELRACDPLRVMAQGLMVGNRDHMWKEPPTEDQVLAWYREEKSKHAGRSDPFGHDGGYANAKGLVIGFEKGVEVLGVTVGRDILGQPAAMLVYRPSRDAIDSYVQSAEIVVEFIDEALSLIKADGMAFISWSG